MIRTRVAWALAIALPSLMVLGADSAHAADGQLRKQIDQHLADLWKRDSITPSPLADDSEFLRRVYIDLVGTIPTYEETVTFLTDRSSDKRSKLIDRLLEDPRYAVQQAEFWDMVLFGREAAHRDASASKRIFFREWLAKQFSDNTPYDQWAKKILKAEGNSVDDGPPIFFVQYKNAPEDATEAVTQIFLGVQLQCARCHDHPFEPWSQVDFYGMAAFYSRLRVVNVGSAKGGHLKLAIGEMGHGDILFTGPVSEDMPGKKGKPVSPKFLLADSLKEPPQPKNYKELKAFPNNKQPEAPYFSRKDALADWVATPDNPYFAKAIANRVWAQFMGRGVVHPVDNMSPSSEPISQELLDTLTKAMIDNKFDLKWYIREVVNSDAYQRSSRGQSGLQFPEKFESARMRPLSAEELAQAWRIAGGYVAAEIAAGKDPSGERWKPYQDSQMLAAFGSPNDGVGDFQGGLKEHLFLTNGPSGAAISQNEGGLLTQLCKSDTPLPERIDKAYLWVLNRPAEPAEHEKITAYVAKGDPKVNWRNVIWAMMTSSEFRFNH